MSEKRGKKEKEMREEIWKRMKRQVVKAWEVCEF